MTPEVAALLDRDAVVAVGTSGGKDSQACALAVHRHLERIGHRGPRLLVHADLGVVEWQDSLPVCERLAEHLGWELVTVRRASGDMLDRWRSRWKGNVRRYNALSVVKLILPWSTPSMRFCTSELKTKIIESALKKRFPGRDILNVVGVRGEESTQRAKAPVSKPNTELSRKGGQGMNWSAIADWSVGDVLEEVDASGLALHQGYTEFNSTRISCAYCIMSSEADMKASASCPDNQEVFRLMVDLEVVSSFGFQGGRWLADMAPHLLREGQAHQVAQAKARGIERQRIEAQIPKHLLFVKKVPLQVPTTQEASLLAHTRVDLAALLGLAPSYVDADSIQERYAQLIGDSANDADGTDGDLDEEHEDSTSLRRLNQQERLCG